MWKTLIFAALLLIPLALGQPPLPPTPDEVVNGGSNTWVWVSLLAVVAIGIYLWYRKR